MTVTLIDAVLTVGAGVPWLTDTGVIIDAINALPTIHTATLSAVFIIGLTVDTRETKGARACVGVDILVTGGTIVAWTRNTFIHIYLTVLAAKSIHTKACVVTNPIKTRSTILTRKRSAVIRVDNTVSALIALCADTVI